jgi:hypothetical protein
MWHLLVWIPTSLLLALWSLLGWAVHGLLTGPDWTDGAPAWPQWLERWQIPAGLAEWLPMHALTALKTWLTALGPWLEDLLQQAPALMQWLAPLLWLVWGVGALGLLLVGGVGSVLVAALREPKSKPPAGPGAPGRSGR